MIEYTKTKATTTISSFFDSVKIVGLSKIKYTQNNNTTTVEFNNTLNLTILLSVKNKALCQ